MRHAHVAHDGLLEDRVVLTMGVQLAGYVRVMHHANIGVGSVVHQFSTVGPFCMIGMGTPVTRDPIPFTMYTARDGQPEGSIQINKVGLERALKKSAEEIKELEVFYEETFSPLKGPMAPQMPKASWFKDDLEAFDRHRAAQERKRPFGVLLL
eukprot:gnl/TRDRNA2_/TRDRNA2_156314_c4_seq1.p1 gnl/TRDRNA2_/TRDRNA2_156314_c4~~gnl/TRDRNA2_/TRDRNA2_156314_c4_seq1.p1  ORF type:complete len:163 (+),score=34.60 gnl/TRDRNA2_/TRDRNA2_156314_c4_seq1:32-490(+)